MAINVFGGGFATVFALCNMFQLLLGIYFDNPSVIEHKHAAFPVGIGIFVEVTDDSAIELPDILKTFFYHNSGCLFASDAACAVCDDGFVLQVFNLVDETGPVPEVFDMGCQSVFESADLAFIPVAGVDNYKFLSLFVEFQEPFGRESLASEAQVDIPCPRVDELFSHSHEHFFVAESGYRIFLEYNFANERKSLKILLENFDFFPLAGDGTVYSFIGKIDFPLNLFLEAEIKQNRLKYFGVFNFCVFVKCNNYTTVVIGQNGFLLK